MTTHTFSGTYSHASDAGFQAWATDYYAQLEAYMVHVTQTGELAYPVVDNRPGTTNTAAGWRMYRLDDALGVSDPVYVKVFVGNGGNITTIPAVQIQVGVGIDGSGGFTGANTGVLGLINTGNTAGFAFPAFSVNTYLCAIEGAFWMAFATGNATLGAEFAFGVFRSSDPDGSPNANAAYIFVGRGVLGTTTIANGAIAAVVRSPSTAFGLSIGYSLAPGLRTGSGGFGGEIEAYLCYYIDPLTRPSPFLCTIWNGEFPLGTTFDAALVGSTPRTYISMADQLGRGSSDVTSKLVGHGLIWE